MPDIDNLLSPPELGLRFAADGPARIMITNELQLRNVLVVPAQDALVLLSAIQASNVERPLRLGPDSLRLRYDDQADAYAFEASDPHRQVGGIIALPSQYAELKKALDADLCFLDRVRAHASAQP